MKVVFFHDGPLYIDGGEQYHNGVLNDNIISRYYDLGEQVCAVTRVKKIVDENPNTIIKSENFSVCEVPNFRKLSSLLQIFAAKRIIKDKVVSGDIVISRLPSSIGMIAARYAKKTKKPCIMEIVGDPWESLRHHSTRGKLLAPKARYDLKKLVLDAENVMYVTDSYLQKKYPSRGNTIGISDVVIPPIEEGVIQQRITKIRNMDENILLGTLGIVSIKYKGQHHVIRALGLLRRSGINNIHYTIAGPGDQTFLKGIAKEEGVEDKIHFAGELQHEEVFNWLDSVDIYIQPSETEGMPRALIEAMSRGCPCIGSCVGGIPELIKEERIFDFKKTPERQLVDIIRAFSKTEMEKDSMRNVERAKDFDRNVLEEKRKEYYSNFLKQYESILYS